MPDNDKLEAFQERLQYRFADPDLLELALRHRSAGSPDNERLEFLGDAVLDVVISEYFYKRFPDASEGAMTRARASLVRGAALARRAGDLGMAEALTMGRGERLGGPVKTSILAGAVEAVIGAVYLDGGMRKAQDVVLALLAEPLQRSEPGERQKDAKTQLQELTQSCKLGLPEYSVLETHGPAHQRSFRVCCRVNGSDASTEGEAASRREAEQVAAAAMLEILAATQA